MVVAICVLVYIVVTYLCLLLQNKLYKIDGTIVAPFVFMSLVPAFNVLVLAVLCIVYIETTGGTNKLAKKLIFIKEEDK